MPAKDSGAHRPFARGIFCKRGHDTWVQFPGTKGPRCQSCDRRRARILNARRRKNNPFWALVENVRRRAKELDLVCTITPDDVEAVYPTDLRCPMLGTPIRPARGYADDQSPTVDRIDPTRGYEPDNIVVISLRANRAKGNMTAAELEAIARWMRHHEGQREETSQCS